MPLLHNWILEGFQVNVKTKISLLSITGLLSVSTLVGGGTFALFTAQAQNSNNDFTAGTLTITQERDDISQIGPMFYTSSTSSQAGVIPNGLWAPGDQHTRGLFLENTGSLTAKLTSLSATPVDANGLSAADASVNSRDLKNDSTFANQSNVIVWELLPVSPSTGNDDVWSNQESATTIEKCVCQAKS